MTVIISWPKASLTLISCCFLSCHCLRLLLRRAYIADRAKKCPIAMLGVSSDVLVQQLPNIRTLMCGTLLLMFVCAVALTAAGIGRYASLLFTLSFVAAVAVIFFGALTRMARKRKGRHGVPRASMSAREAELDGAIPGEVAAHHYRRSVATLRAPAQ